jgi:hypothetical protein
MIKNTLAVESAPGYRFATLTKTHSRDEITTRLAQVVQVIPERHFLLGNVPESKLAIYAGAQKVIYACITPMNSFTLSNIKIK